MTTFACRICFGIDGHAMWCDRYDPTANAGTSITIPAECSGAVAAPVSGVPLVLTTAGVESTRSPADGTWGEAATGLARAGVELKVDVLDPMPSAVDLAGDECATQQYPNNLGLDPDRIKVDPSTGDVEIVAPGEWKFNLPGRSEWVCYLFGTSKENAPYNVWYPLKNQVPNAFTRWMMKVCFACTWVKEKK